MIREVILTSQSSQGHVHLAPMGIHIEGDERLLMPFRPSTTLDNVLATGTAVMNYCDDVRLFAGCLTGRRDWPLLAADKIIGWRLAGALSHAELELVRHEDDPVRPKLYCRVIHEVNHAPFQGFNRAQFAVLQPFWSADCTCSPRKSSNQNSPICGLDSIKPPDPMSGKPGVG